ncbi:DNA mismatch endonuclease Vsr [Mesorhizobium sp. B2-2-2]|uniref:very short patch repair endonuclease n=1 Tax=Mesorhizobium sp. B2-2-2 TaxID=2589964 RepID=UPI00112D3AF8|nr:very short patch repair endonuclease [Mesorhizobium sp. B2-2-2]TPM33540.1 DNA mismatch endonuclease Vsr [Mesorhizobium sp. B2-2-2]
MTDPVDPARSRQMALIRSKDTKPELKVRRLAHSLGYRYRLHGADLPGKPDMVFRSRKAVIFIHGCFWHGHDCKRGNRPPTANADYWRKKIARNVERDTASMEALAAAGWKSLIVWECEIKDSAALERRLREFLDAG